MPNKKKTKHTNKKRNQKLQKETEGEPVPDELAEVFDVIDENAKNRDKNILYAKKLSYELFGKYKDNMIYGKQKDKTTKKIITKLIKKKKLKQDEYGFIEYDGIHYAINIALFKEWEALTKKVTGFSMGAGKRLEKEIHTIKNIFLELLLNPPKANGEVMNFNLGFLGSIWIDTHNKFRIAIYNGTSKDYDVKDFKPHLCFLDNSNDDCKFKIEKGFATKSKEGVKVTRVRTEDGMPNEINKIIKKKEK